MLTQRQFEDLLLSEMRPNVKDFDIHAFKLTPHLHLYTHIHPRVYNTLNRATSLEHGDPDLSLWYLLPRMPPEV